MDIISKTNASTLRHFFIEYTVLFLTAAVVILFYMYRDLNSKIIELQTNVIMENTKAQIELKSELQNFKNSKQ